VIDHNPKRIPLCEPHQKKTQGKKKRKNRPREEGPTRKQPARDIHSVTK